MNFKDYPLDDRCRWWCEMNCWRKPAGFPFKLPPIKTPEWMEMFKRLTKATPNRERMKCWKERYCQ